MKHLVWLGIVLLGILGGYHYGFKQGNFAQRLEDAESMGQRTADEMTRHYQEENYWNDRAWDCEAVMKQHKLSMPVKKSQGTPSPTRKTSR